jgi:hypothetical protein
LWVDETPDGERPQIAVWPDEHFGATSEERDRLATEATRAVVLVAEGGDTQARLLERVARASPDGQLRFSYAATLERFMAVTAGLDDASAAALSDDELVALWRDADLPGEGDPSRPG